MERAVAPATMTKAPTNEIDVGKMLEEILCSLVDRPEELRLEPVFHAEEVTFRVQAHSTDVGKLIGKGGQTARALRIILAANGMRMKRTFSLDIVK
ncbi:MAG: KH domain-containing protein [Janthinobacterium lividum]